MAAYQQLRSVSRLSLPPGLLTLTAIKESFGAAAGAFTNDGNAMFSCPWTWAERIRHTYDRFVDARIQRPDPEPTSAFLSKLPLSGRSNAHAGYSWGPCRDRYTSAGSTPSD